ncbi:acyl-CoA dehydrogenase family protein [Streptomyces sp. NPDC008238]
MAALRGGVPRRRGARPGRPERRQPARAHAPGTRHPGAARPRPAAHGARRGDLGAGLVRAGGGLRPGVAALHRHPHRRRLAAARPEDVELGRHAVPGPLAETVAAAALLEALPDPGPAEEWLPRVAEGRALLGLADPEGGHALDADAADGVLLVSGDRLLLAREHGPPLASLDPVRRLARPRQDTAAVLATGPAVVAAAARAADRATLVTAAQALGVGLALLARTVEHVRRRHQFGVPVGSFQAVKHRLADTLIALEFARPLLHGAAVTGTGADVAAAKAACGEAAYRAARTALQLHGALGYTAEYDLSLWLTKARALRSAWGTPARCRARVLAETPR